MRRVSTSKSTTAPLLYFNITENNNVGGTIDLLKPLTGGTLSLGIGAGTELMRQNKRSFLVTDTFASLLHNRPSYVRWTEQGRKLPLSDHRLNWASGTDRHFHTAE